MTVKKLITLVIVALALIITNVGCGGSGTTAKTNASGSSTEVKK